jgi:hypothetical protein
MMMMMGLGNSGGRDCGVDFATVVTVPPESASSLIQYPLTKTSFSEIIEDI